MGNSVRRRTCFAAIVVLCTLEELYAYLRFGGKSALFCAPPKHIHSMHFTATRERCALRVVGLLQSLLPLQQIVEMIADFQFLIDNESLLLL